MSGTSRLEAMLDDANNKLAESKQREAELLRRDNFLYASLKTTVESLADVTRERHSAIRAHAEEQKIAVQMQQERDAALIALEIARMALRRSDFVVSHAKVLASIVDPAAALAERDRAIERKTAQRVLELNRCFEGARNQSEFEAAARREFNLEPKT